MPVQPSIGQGQRQKTKTPPADSRFIDPRQPSLNSKPGCIKVVDTFRSSRSNSALCGATHNAEFERTLILSRTTDGRMAAKARGVAFGRPKKLRPDRRELARELVRDGKSISAVARTFNVHPATIYRVIEG
jgi:hypothetical protein